MILQNRTPFVPEYPVLIHLDYIRKFIVGFKILQFVHRQFLAIEIVAIETQLHWIHFNEKLYIDRMDPSTKCNKF